MIVWFLFGSLLFFLNSLRGAPIEDLCLAFTLPGFPDYVLKEGEQNIIVSDVFMLGISCSHLLFFLCGK